MFLIFHVYLYSIEMFSNTSRGTELLIQLECHFIVVQNNLTFKFLFNR